jgi:hypothetical protein
VYFKRNFRVSASEEIRAAESHKIEEEVLARTNVDDDDAPPF